MLAGLALLAGAGSAQANKHDDPPALGGSKLTARAVLPAKTFAPGPISGQRITAANGVAVPFASQPVQGFSAMVYAGGQDYWAMPDNGYGAQENSDDFLLRIYRIQPHFKTKKGGDGSVAVKNFISLRDPDHRAGFALVNEYTRDRLLTGEDFDIESLQVGKDGTLWIGDEFGPYLLHFSADGVLLEPPIKLPDPDNAGQDLRSPQSPESEESSTLRVMEALRSAGSKVAPVVSPDYALIDDGDATTGVASRLNPPAGLPKAASDIMNLGKLHTSGFKVVPYTVDDPAAMAKLLKLGVDGEISDRPDLLQKAVADAGLTGKVDTEAHRGGRDLRPENTLPSMEVGMDNLVTTLETDNGITADGIPVLSHDPYVTTDKCRRTDGKPFTHDILIKTLTFHELQSSFVCDGVIRTGTPQTNDRSLSPVAVAFAKAQGLADPYVMPSDQQLFDFVRFYGQYYSAGGAGANDPGAADKAAEAAKVKFNIETKINPRSDRDPLGNVYSQRTVGVNKMADTVADAIIRGGMADRSDVQSFDFRTLLRVARTHPELPLVALWGDFTIEDPDDGTNLEPEPGGTTSPWLAGLYWPYRETAVTHPFRAQQSGGLEGMAQSPDQRMLYPMLEKPLTGGPANLGTILQYDTKLHRWVGGRRAYYPYEAKGVSVGDFQLVDDTHGLFLERDNSQGDLSGFKTVEEAVLGKPGAVMKKAPAANEMTIRDPFGISLPGLPGDIGLGNPFAFPFNTIEDLVVLDRENILVGDDNNFPFSLGRHVGSGQPDDNELITLKLDHAVGGKDDPIDGKKK